MTGKYWVVDAGTTAPIGRLDLQGPWWAIFAGVTHGETERRTVVEQTVATAETNMRVLAGDLATDAGAIRRAKHAEFHSLGLVLGYTYAGSPVVQDSIAARKVEDVTTYTPTTAPGSRLPHHWFADGSSLYDHVGPGLTLIGPGAPTDPRVTALTDQARDLGVPLTVLDSPPAYPWHHLFLLVRPDQHIAWRDTDPTGIDLRAVTGHHLTSATETVE